MISNLGIGQFQSYSATNLKTIIRRDWVIKPHFWVMLVMLVIISVLYCGFNIWFPWLKELLFFEFFHNIMGSLFFLPLIYGLVYIRWTVLLVWFIFLITTFLFPLSIGLDIGALLHQTVVSLIPMTIAVIGVLGFELKKIRSIAEKERENERQMYLNELTKAQEHERQRISQELHDHIIQALIALAKRTKALAYEPKKQLLSTLRREADGLSDNILELADDIRRLSYDLRPSILDNIGLVPALRWLSGTMSQQSGIKITFRNDSEIPKLSSEIEVNIFRIIQEALNNVVEHSKAMTASVITTLNNNCLRITVKDEGTGFTLKRTSQGLAASGKLGVLGMQQRTKFINGIIDIDSAVGAGTTVTVELKLSHGD